MSSAGDLVAVAVSDGGNFGCELLCGAGAALPMAATASIAIVVEGASAEPYNPLDPSSETPLPAGAPRWARVAFSWPFAASHRDQKLQESSFCWVNSCFCSCPPGGCGR